MLPPAPLTHMGFKVISTIHGICTVGRLGTIIDFQEGIYRRLGEMRR